MLAQGSGGNCLRDMEARRHEAAWGGVPAVETEDGRKQRERGEQRPGLGVGRRGHDGGLLEGVWGCAGGGHNARVAGVCRFSPSGAGERVGRRCIRCIRSIGAIAGDDRSAPVHQSHPVSDTLTPADSVHGVLDVQARLLEIGLCAVRTTERITIMLPKAAAKALNRYRKWTEPLPLHDFAEYDGYWEGRGLGEPNVHRRWRIAAAKVPDGATLLDVGCGTGGFLTFLREQKPNAVLAGTDISDAAVAQARAKGHHVFRADLTQEPLADTYDYITCFEVIEHIHEAEQVLVAMRDAVSKQLIMSLPNFGYFEHRIRLGLFGRFPNTTLMLHAKEHIRHWTVQDFIHWTGHFGLVVVDIQGQRAMMPGAPWRRFPRLFASQLVYTLEKA
jgi:methionine biosynthesis protein MetW